ncbi:hypothetical protein GCM10027589_15040 [Actinocorallia lasiicapitis]
MCIIGLGSWVRMSGVGWVDRVGMGALGLGGEDGWRVGDTEWVGGSSDWYEWCAGWA